MNSEQEQYEWIERYLNKQLDEQEQQLFEQQLEEDTAFREEVAVHRITRELLVDKNLLDLREEMQAFTKSIKAQEPLPVEKPLRRLPLLGTWQRMAAALVLLIGLSAIMYYTTFREQATGNTLFASYFEPYPSDYSPQRNDEGTAAILDAAFLSYEQQNYPEALAGFQSLPEQASGNPMIRFYKGQCYLYTGAIEAAIRSFEYVLADGDNYYLEASRWYLALAYIKEDKMGKAKKILIKLSAEAGMYQKQAKALLRKIA